MERRDEERDEDEDDEDDEDEDVNEAGGTLLLHSSPTSPHRIALLPRQCGSLHRRQCPCLNEQLGWPPPPTKTTKCSSSPSSSSASIRSHAVFLPPIVLMVGIHSIPEEDDQKERALNDDDELFQK